MSVKSVYIPEPRIENNRVRITDEEHRHLAVARAGKGEEIEVFDGKGNIWAAAVESIGKRETIASITSSRTAPPESIGLVLGQALIRAGAFELALEKAVEVGVTRIVPFAAARSNVARAARNDRWQRIIVEAAKQSKRYYLPAVDEPVGFDEIVRMPAASKILFAERDGGPLKSALAGSPVLYLIGPEGGWTESELSLAREHGFKLASLGTGILKAETAAIVGAALIRYELS